MIDVELQSFHKYRFFISCSERNRKRKKKQHHRNKYKNKMAENNPSFNFNTPEAKVAEEVAQQFVAKRSGRILINARRETEIMLLRVSELEPKQADQLLTLVKSLNISEENCLASFTRLSEQIFNKDICWGRIVTFFLFTALLMEHLKSSGKDTYNEKIGQCLGVCIARKTTWIRQSGGWVRNYIHCLLFF